jgi:alpha-glucoside transport system permease protein
MSSSAPPPVKTPPDTEAPASPQPPEPGSSGRAMEVAIAVALPILSIVIGIWSFNWMQSTESNRLLVVLVACLVGVGGVFAVFFGADRLVNLLPESTRETVRPWVFVGPGLVLLAVFLLYPGIQTVVASFQNDTSTAFVGLDNYEFVFSDPAMLRAIRNTIAWMFVVPIFATGIGLVFATLADRLRRGESLAKSLIFLPMAISFVGASVVWAFIYDFQAFGNQTGLLNGIWTALGNDPVDWVTGPSMQPWNNFFLMVIMIWMQTGFAMVILSAAIKSVPEDIIEAARIDGATEFQVFMRVIVPSIMSAIVVVLTTMTINVLKIFDIVWVMTGGQSGTEVLAERMVRQFFSFTNNGRGAAVAVLLFIFVLPMMVWNVRRFREEEATR